MRPLPLVNPPNPFAKTEVVYLEGDTPGVRLEVHLDRSGSVLSRNDSPDLGFTYSVNPYRGCFHGCAYCYARPTHEYLGFGAGTDFERKIVVKPDAPALLRRALRSARMAGRLIMFSGVTDCYQPLESRYRLTRGCLEACLEHRNPVHVVTKSPLVERDVDVLLALSRVARVGVSVSIPFFQEEHARALEPYVTTPARRLKTIERLARAGVPVGVSVAPIVPGLGDEDIPAVLRAARDAGATWAWHALLRLPGHVQDVFVARLKETLPLRADWVLARIRETRDGKLNDATFGKRARGEGPYAETLTRLFETTARRLGLASGAAVDETPLAPLADAAPPAAPAQPRRRQLTLF